MGEVVTLSTGEVGDGVRVAPAKVLTGATEANLGAVVIIGRDADGDLYFASSDGSMETLWLIEKAKAVLLEGE